MNMWLSIILALVSGGLAAQSVDTLLLSSEKFGRAIIAFTYDTAPDVSHKPIVYLTDGKKVLDNGALAQIIKLTKADKILPAYYVFVSTIDLQTQTDHRNEYFFGNPNYLAFFEQELIPAVEARCDTTFEPKDRSLVGVSFGGLNAAYFSAKSSLFQHYGLLSPITYPYPSLMQDLVFSPNKSLNIFLSTGQQDAEQYLKPLHQVYISNGYSVEVLETEGGHDFGNWNAQWEAVLSFLLH